MEFQLTGLEKAVLLKKTGVAKTLLEARGIWLQEMDGVYDAEKSPEGDWDETSWYGGPNSGGYEGFYGNNTLYRVELSGRRFIILEKRVVYKNDSRFDTNYQERDYPIKFYYVFCSEGEDLDAARVSRQKLEELLASAERHLPEALEIFRKEYLQYKVDDGSH